MRHETMLMASEWAVERQQPIPKCATPGCRLWVACDTPKREWKGMLLLIGPSVPTGDKCWYHANWKEPPHDAR